MKRFLSVLLSLVIVCSCFSITTVNATQEEDIVSIARSQIGYHGRPNDFTYWYGSIGGTYSYHWCAAFVSWCANQAGISTNIIPKHCSCNTGMKWFKDRGLWQDSIYQGGSYTPQAGDIVYYSDSYSQSDSTHVGIVTGTNGEYLTVVEGNTENNQVKEYTANSKRKLNSGYILGYGTPNYPPQEPEINYWYDDLEPTDLGYKFSAYIEHKNTKIYLTSNEDKVTGQEQNGGDNQKWNFTRMDNGAYIISTFDNSKYMDVWGSGTNDNTVVHLYNECTYEKNQQFFIYEINGSYYFRPLYTDKVFDMKEIPDYDLTIWSQTNDHTPQMFDIVKLNLNEVLPADLGENFCAYIEHKNTKMYLTGNEDKISGQKQNGDDNQKWNFTRMDNGAYIISTFDNSKFMDVWGSGTNDNTVVHLYNECTYEKNQQFFIYEINGSYYFRPLYTDKVFDMKEIPNYDLTIWSQTNDHTPQMFDIVKLNLNEVLPAYLGENFCAYIKHKNTEMYLTGNEDKISGQAQNGGDTQKWNFTSMDNGAYIISTFDNSKYMDVWGSGTNDNTVVHLYNECTYEKNQQFFIYEINGSYYFRPLYTDKVFDMKEIPDYDLTIWSQINDHTPQMFDILEITGIIGDIDGDDMITIKDSTAIQKHLANALVLDDKSLTLADANGDGIINISDSTQIQKYLTQLVDKLG